MAFFDVDICLFKTAEEVAKEKDGKGRTLERRMNLLIAPLKVLSIS